MNEEVKKIVDEPMFQEEVKKPQPRKRKTEQKNDDTNQKQELKEPPQKRVKRQGSRRAPLYRVGDCLLINEEDAPLWILLVSLEVPRPVKKSDPIGKIQGHKYLEVED